MKALVVFDGHVGIQQLRSELFDNSEEIILLPLTPNQSLVAKFVEAIGQDKCRVLDAAKLINNTASIIKKPYLEFIAQLPSLVNAKGKNLSELLSLDEHVSLWWLSLVAEKNVYKSDSFNRLVQLDTIIHVIKEENVGYVEFACSSEKLGRALSHFCNGNNIKLGLCFRPNSRVFLDEFLRPIKMWVKNSLALLKCFVKTLLLNRAIKTKMGKLARSKGTKESLMFVTGYPCFDRNKADQGVYRNGYFFDIQKELEVKGKDVLWLGLYVPHSEYSLDESLDLAEKFVHNGYSLYFLNEFADLRMQIKAILKTLLFSFKFYCLRLLIREAHDFRGYQVYDIFEDDWLKTFVGEVGYQGILFYEMFREVFTRLQMKECVYICEMMAWEKALIYARKQIKAETNVLAYCHSSISDMLLNYHSSPVEIRSNDRFFPRPDKVLCNGSRSFDFMTESGWDESETLIVEAVRYGYLSKDVSTVFAEKENVVLLGLSASVEESSSLLNFVYYSLKDKEDVTVWIKPHPFAPIDQVVQHAGLYGIDLPFVLKNDSISTLLSKARVAIVGQSTASLEALYFGCHVIVVNSPEWMNMSSLRFVEGENISIVYSVENLALVIDSLFSVRIDEDKYRKDTRRILDKFFCFNNELNEPVKFLEVLGVKN